MRMLCGGGARGCCAGAGGRAALEERARERGCCNRGGETATAGECLARHKPCFGPKIRNRQVLHAHLKIKISGALAVGESKLIASPAKVGAAAGIGVPITGGREHACDCWIADVQSLK